MLTSPWMEQRGEVVFAVATAPLRIGGVHRLEMRPEQLLVPDERASTRMSRDDRADPLDLGLGDGHRVLQLEEHEPGEAEVVLGHPEGRVERGDPGAKADDPRRERGLGALLGDVPEQPDGDPEDRRLVDRGREQIGEPVLELLTPLRR